MNDNPPNSSESNPKNSDTTSENEKDQETSQELSSPLIPPIAPHDDENGQEKTLDTDEQNNLGARMTFLEHLDELRKRILHSVVGITIAFCACWTLREEIFYILALPIADVVGGVDKLIFIKPTEPFSIWLKVSFVAAIFVNVFFDIK